MTKWRLVFKTLPWVALVLVLTYVRDYVLDIRSLVDFGDIGAVITGAALIIGFMLAGVIADYKESEKLPGELAASLEAIDDAIVAGSRTAQALDAAPYRARYGEIVATVCEWFLNRRPVDDCFAALRRMTDLTADLDRAGVGAVPVSRLLAEQASLRRLVTRVAVIRRTHFIQTGYALLQMFLGTTIALLIFSNFKNWLVQFLVVGALSMIYIYLLQLIRDLDDPFEYADGFREGGSADVSPHPILEFRARYETSLREGAGVPRTAAAAVR